MPRVKTPLKYHGGKDKLAGWIVEHFPPRAPVGRREEPNGGYLHYVEPCAGGLSVLLANDPEGVSEVVNDVSGKVANFWMTLTLDATFRRLHEVLQTTPVSEEIYRIAVRHQARPCDRPGEVCVSCAWAFFVVARQSLAGRQDTFGPLSRTRVRRDMNEQASAWLTAIEGLPEVHERLKRVVILNRDVLECVRTQDGPATLFYVDPPYLPETRSTPEVYAYEMTASQHFDLLETLAQIEGRFLLSGYRSSMYDDAARRHGWNRHDKTLANSAAGGATKRTMTECLWANY